MTTDEKARRRSRFDIFNSVPIVLADEQRWFFPKPWLAIRPCFRSGRAISSHQLLTYGDDLDQLITAIGNGSDEAAIVNAIASLGAYLLLVNYELTDLELGTLFDFRLGDEASLEWAKQVMDLATGQSGPKVFSDGGA